MCEPRDGIVAEVDVERCLVKVRFPDRGGVLSPWLRVLQRNTFANKDYGLPDAGELVACLLNETEATGWVMGAFYTKENAPPDPSPDVRRVTFADGSKVEYDRENNKLTINLGDGTSEFLAELLTIVGNVHIDGQLQVGGGAEAVAGAHKTNQRLDALEQFAATHVHTGVTAGAGSTGTATPGTAPSGSSVAMSDTTTD